MLKIGDKLYKRVGLVGILTFTVYEIREQEKLTLYAIREEKRGYELLVAKDVKKDIYHFVSMLNDDEDENGYYDNTPNSLGLDSEYYASKSEAIKWTLSKNIDCLKEELEEKEQQVKRIKNKIKEYKLHIKDIDTLEEYYNKFINQ